jgi:hypothetical protein
MGEGNLLTLVLKGTRVVRVHCAAVVPRTLWVTSAIMSKEWKPDRFYPTRGDKNLPSTLHTFRDQSAQSTIVAVSKAIAQNPPLILGHRQKLTRGDRAHGAIKADCLDNSTRVTRGPGYHLPSLIDAST